MTTPIPIFKKVRRRVTPGSLGNLLRLKRKAETQGAAGWTVAQLRERLEAAQLAGATDGAADYRRCLQAHPATQ